MVGRILKQVRINDTNYPSYTLYIAYFIHVKFSNQFLIFKMLSEFIISLTNALLLDLPLSYNKNPFQYHTLGSIHIERQHQPQH